MGHYTDAAGKLDGFKLKNGVLAGIHYPGSTSTTVNSISDKGVIVGGYGDSQGLGHGSVPDNGVYTTLDDPKADPNPGTNLTDINSSGAIVGVYYNGPLAHSFIYINGVFKEIIVLNAIYPAVVSLNGYGDVTGTANFYLANYTYFTARCQ